MSVVVIVLCWYGMYLAPGCQVSVVVIVLCWCGMTLAPGCQVLIVAIVCVGVVVVGSWLSSVGCRHCPVSVWYVLGSWLSSVGCRDCLCRCGMYLTPGCQVSVVGCCSLSFSIVTAQLCVYMYKPLLSSYFYNLQNCISIPPEANTIFDVKPLVELILLIKSLQSDIWLCCFCSSSFKNTPRASPTPFLRYMICHQHKRHITQTKDSPT